MDVFLRKASALARACADAAAKIKLEPFLRLSPYSQATTSQSVFLAEADAALTRRMIEVNDLHTAKATIRRLIGEANATEVSRLLSERECIDACMKTISSVIEASTRAEDRFRSDSVIRVEHNSMTVQTTLQTLIERGTTTGELSNVEVTALTPSMIQSWEDELARLRRRRADLMDELASANLRHKITIPDDVVVVLRKHKIID